MALAANAAEAHLFGDVLQKPLTTQTMRLCQPISGTARRDNLCRIGGGLPAVRMARTQPRRPAKHGWLWLSPRHPFSGGYFALHNRQNTFAASVA